MEGELIMNKQTNQAFDNLAEKTIQITSQALHQKELIIKELKEKLANCTCPEVPHA
jgi:hypothetical protein